MHRRVLQGLLLAVTALTGAAQAASAQEPVTLVAGMEAIPLAGHVAVLRDEQGDWTLDDVRSPAIRDQFAIAEAARFNNRLSLDAFWYRLLLRNPAAPENMRTDWILDIQFPTLDFVDVHVTRR